MYDCSCLSLCRVATKRGRINSVKVSALTGSCSSPLTIRRNERGRVYFMLKIHGEMRYLYYLPVLRLGMGVKVPCLSIDWGEFLIRKRASFEGIAS
jgi:hypothetical protein